MNVYVFENIYMYKAMHVREVGEIEGVNRAHTKLLIIAGPIIERGQSKVIEN